jgi:uncharacterized protein YjbJ (UPF0337 family)
MGNIVRAWVMDNNHKEAFMHKEINGRVEKTKVKVKEVTGKMLHDKSLEVEKKAQKKHRQDPGGLW